MASESCPMTDSENNLPVNPKITSAAAIPEEYQNIPAKYVPESLGCFASERSDGFEQKKADCPYQNTDWH